MCTVALTFEAIVQKAESLPEDCLGRHRGFGLDKPDYFIYFSHGILIDVTLKFFVRFPSPELVLVVQFLGQIIIQENTVPIYLTSQTFVPPVRPESHSIPSWRSSLP
jgi:hypothetical protein